MALTTVQAGQGLPLHIACDRLKDLCRSTADFSPVFTVPESCILFDGNMPVLLSGGIKT